MFGTTAAPRSWRADLNKALKITVDVARSANAGVGRGFVALAGLQGDLQKFVNDQTTNLAERTGLLSNAQASRARTLEPLTRRMSPPGLFGGGGLTSTEIMQSPPGSVRRGVTYAPQTTPGRYARTGGEFALNALAPGTGPLKLAAVALPAVTSEAAGQATQGTPWEAPSRLGGAMIGGGLTGALLRASGVPMRQIDPRILEGIEYKPHTKIDRALDSIEDVFGRGSVRVATPRKFVGVSEDGTKQLRMDLYGHRNDPPHFHLEKLAPGEGPVDIFMHQYPFK